MELVFPLHAAWVWNNYFSLSLSLFLPFSPSLYLIPLFLYFAVLWPPSTLGFWDRAPLCSHCTLHFLLFFRSVPLSLSLPLPCSPPPLSVVYQDGFYGAADLYVSKFTSNRHTISVPPLTAFSCSFFFPSWGDSACVSGHALHRAASIMVNGENSLEARHATYLHKVLCLLCMSVVFRRQTCWLSHNWAPAVFI